MCKPCDCCFVSMNSHFLFHIWSQLKSCWNSTVQQCSHTKLGRSKIVLPRDWSEKPNKTSWNFAVLPLLHLFYQKSHSCKSRIRVYLLLVDRDPTTTTHKQQQQE
jgi:hypothetical protein